MNALRDLTAGQGCSADGTSATANPLTGLVNQAMGMGAQKGGAPRGGIAGPMAAPQVHQSEIERAMAAGMGLTRAGDTRSPFERAAAAAQFQQGFPAQQFHQSPFERAMQGDAMAREFQQQFRGAPPSALLGPRGHAPQAMGDAWINDFQRMNMRGEPFGVQSARTQGWIQEMARGPPPAEMELAWRQKNAMEGGAWANEMAQQRQQQDAICMLTRSARKQEDASQKQEDDFEATRRATEDMVRVMSENPKFRNSEFFDFMQKVSTGELKFENNEVVQGVATAPMRQEDPLAAAWAETTAAKAPEPTSMEDLFSRAWKDGELNDAELDNAFKQMMAQAQAEGGYDYDSAWGANESMWDLPNMINPLEQQYELEQNNPYANTSNAFEEGMKFFQAGNLPQAVLAFQAVVGKEPNHSEAWRMLGAVHQENDEDKKAILCLERAVEHDAYNLDAVLALGVSYVNELDQTNALKNLKAWVVNNPAFVGLEVQRDEYSDGSMMDEVMQLMLKAAEWAPKDPQVQEVLGVLFNVTRDYSSAAAAFRKAIDARPDDHSLWNKCGATLANSSPSRSEEAIPAYLRAIELRPGYARAHLNLGISYNNLGNFEAAARAYMRALELSPSATHIWQYIKISFTCMERQDLVALCEARDLPSLKKLFH